MGRRPADNPLDWAAIVKAYKAGESTDKIAKRFGTWSATIATGLHRAGVVMRPKGSRRPGVDWKAIERLKTSGMTVAELSRQFGLPQSTISGHFRRRDTPTVRTRRFKKGVPITVTPGARTRPAAFLERLLDDHSLRVA